MKRTSADHSLHDAYLRYLCAECQGLPPPLRQIMLGLLTGAAVVAIDILGLGDPPLAGWDSNDFEISHAKLSGVYASILTYFVFLFTYHGQSASIRRGSELLVSEITEEAEVVSSLMRDLRDETDQLGTLDMKKTGVVAYDGVRNVLGLDSGVISLMSFVLVSGRSFVEAGKSIGKELNKEEQRGTVTYLLAFRVPRGRLSECLACPESSFRINRVGPTSAG